MFQICYVNLLHKIVCNVSIFLRSTEGGVGGWMKAGGQSYYWIEEDYFNYYWTINPLHGPI